MNIYTFTRDYKKMRMSMGGRTFLDILNGKEELCFKLYLNKAKMPGLIIWGKDRILTEYGKRKFREILEAETLYDLDENAFIVKSTNYRQGFEFCRAAAGLIPESEYFRIFGTEKEWMAEMVDER